MRPTGASSTGTWSARSTSSSAMPTGAWSWSTSRPRREVLRPPGRGLAPALDLQLRDRHERPRGRGGPPPPLRRAHQDQAARAPPLLDHPRPRGERPALPAWRPRSSLPSMGRLPSAGRLALPGLPGAEPVLGVGVSGPAPAPRRTPGGSGHERGVSVDRRGRADVQRGAMRQGLNIPPRDDAGEGRGSGHGLCSRQRHGPHHVQRPRPISVTSQNRRCCTGLSRRTSRRSSRGRPGKTGAAGGRRSCGASSRRTSSVASWRTACSVFSVSDAGTRRWSPSAAVGAGSVRRAAAGG